MATKDKVKKKVKQQATTDLRAKTVTDLTTMLMGLHKEHFDLRMQHGTGQLSDSTKLGKVKRSIARVKTIIKEKSND